MAANDGKHIAKGAQRLADFFSDYRVLLHDVPFLWGESGIFTENFVRNAYFAKIVQVPTSLKRNEAVVVQAEVLAQLAGVTSEPRAMISRIGIACFHTERERKNDGLGVVELICEFLQLQQRTHARKQLFRI